VPYGFAIGDLMGGGIYFNQRLFEEAGLDPELPFNLQAAGEWTWDAFMEIAHALTRDTDNDGIDDTFALAAFSNDILSRALASNHATYVGRNPETGEFFNATNTPEFLEALTFVNNLHVEGVMMPQPEGSEWNWFDEAFWNADVAMRTGGTYMAGAHINDRVDDPWGFVAFPMGPQATEHQFFTYHNVSVIPSSFSQDEIDDIMFAFQLWQQTPEGFDDPDAWIMPNLVNFSNPRSVEETLAMFARNQSLHATPFNVFIPGLNVGDIAWAMWHEDSDPTAIVEAVQASWNTIISDAN
jgi:ABC-type glycerol-3-phosphate transport system substrate-binding protein